MKEVEFKLSKNDYVLFLKFIYFADYCATHNLISDFSNNENRERISKIINRLYKLGDQFELPKSISLSSLSSELRFSEDAYKIMKHRTESDLKNIANKVFAREFAIKQIDKEANGKFFDFELGWMVENDLIWKRMQPFLKEFSENGVTNLKFKLLYSLPQEENNNDE